MDHYGAFLGEKSVVPESRLDFQKLIVDERNPETTSDVKITHGKWDILDFDWCRISCINSMRIRDVSWNSAC